MRRVSIVPILLLGTVLGGCGGGDSTPGPRTRDAPEEAAEDLPPTEELPPADAEEETQDEDAEPSDAPGEVAPGEFGAPCVQNGDCTGGFCVEGPLGFVCTRQCLEDCPDGWSCRTIPIGSDVASLCVPAGAELCKPCMIDAQCGDGLCLGSGDARRCGRNCEAAPCPAGYRCEDVAAGEGATSRQCLPVSGSCGGGECSTSTHGVKRPCLKSNGIGTCFGFEVCDALVGWVGCNAPEAVPEECNGRDDDCDGVGDAEGAPGCVPYWPDADQDGFGATGAGSKCLCGPAEGYTARISGDCADDDKTVYPNAPETCDGKDQDCDGNADDGVLSPCGSCNAVCTVEAGPGTGDPFQPAADNSSGIGAEDDGDLVLDSQKIDMPFMWVANSGEDTVSKIDTKTGCEQARYAVCDDPSRTAVDLTGNGIVACRGDGRVAKIGVGKHECFDANANGQIDTVADLDGDCRISPDEMVAGDECLLWMVQPDGATIARAAGVDEENNIWIGFYDSKRLMRLSTVDGSVLKTVQLQEKPYGLAIDQGGLIWVGAREPQPHRLVKVSPTDGRLGSWETPSGKLYGLAVDPYGKVWVASGEASGLHRFDPVTSQWTHTWSWPGRGYTRGVAASVGRNPSGGTGSRIYVAHNTFNCIEESKSRTISVVDAKEMKDEPAIDLGDFRGPVGVAVDFDGYLWSVNMCEGGDATDWPGTVSRIDPNAKTVLDTFPVGKRPYTYSDMTGYALKTITAPQGWYRHVFQGWPNQPTVWHLIYVDADLPGAGKTWAKVRFRTLESPGISQTSPWQGPFGPFPPASLPLDLDKTIGEGAVVGNWIEIEVTLGTEGADFVPVLHGIRVLASEK